MTSETAQLVLAIITAVAFAVWLAGVQFVWRSAQKPPSTDDEVLSAVEGQFPGNWVHDSVEVPGDPASLAARATARLVQETSGLGTLKIVERADNRIRFEPAAAPVLNQPGVRRGELRFQAVGGGRTRIDIFLELPSQRLLIGLAAGFLAGGLIALIAGCWLIYATVATAPDPGIRWQTLQMLQVVHFLWPPFLFGSLFRRMQREARSRFDAMTHNLPYQPD